MTRLEQRVVYGVVLTKDCQQTIPQGAACLHLFVHPFGCTTVAGDKVLLKISLEVLKKKKHVVFLSIKLCDAIVIQII